MTFSRIKVHWNNAKEYLIVIISKGKLDLVLQKANIRCPKSLLQTTELHIILIDTCPTLRSPNRTVHEGNNSVYLFPNWAFVLFRMSTLHLESIRLFHIFRYLLEEKEINDEFFWWNTLRRKKKSREVMGTWWMQTAESYWLWLIWNSTGFWLSVCLRKEQMLPTLIFPSEYFLLVFFSIVVTNATFIAINLFTDVQIIEKEKKKYNVTPPPLHLSIFFCVASIQNSMDKLAFHFELSIMDFTIF